MSSGSELDVVATVVHSERQKHKCKIRWASGTVLELVFRGVDRQ